jgi:hypothetical protein
VIRLALVIAVIPVIATLASPSRAAGQTPDRRADEARALFDRGREALDTGRFAAARDLFRRSIEVAPNVASAFNLAIALRGTGETRSAIETFERLLEGGYGEISPEQRRQIAELLGPARGDLGHLTVVVRGAEEIELRIDGALIATAHDGETVRREIDPGEHVITASAPRRTSYEQAIVVERGATVSVDAELGANLLGTLVVESRSPDATLEIVGVVRGAGSVRRELPPGEYRVAVIDAAGRREIAARVESGELVRVALSDSRPDAPLVESPWLWSGIAAAVIGAALAIVLPLTITVDEPPISDPVYGVVVTLTAP